MSADRRVPPVIAELEAARTGQGMSQSELARRSGISRWTIMDLLATGKGQLYTLFALADVLGVNLHIAPKPGPRQAKRDLQPCGTQTAARRHYARGEELDPLCRAAQRDYDRDRKRAVAAARRAERGRAA